MSRAGRPIAEPVHVALLLFLLLSTSAAWAATSPPLRLTAATRHLSMNGHVDAYVDSSGERSFAQVAHAAFTPCDIRRNAGFVVGAHWYRFRIRRTAGAPREWVLAMGAPYLDLVDVWVRPAHGAPRKYHMGDHADYAQRPLRTRLFAVPLRVPAGGVTVFVKVRSISVTNFKADIWQPAAFTAEETRVNFLHGFYFGILGIIIVLYLLLGTWLKDSSMLAYSCYVTTLLLMYLGIDGYFAVFFAPGVPWASDVVVGVGMIGGLVSMAALWVLLLKIDEVFPRIGRLYRAVALAAACTIPFAATPLYRVIAPLVLQIGMAIAVSNLVILALLWWRQRRAELLLYFCAFLATIVGSLLAVATTLGWLPYHSLSAHAYEYASLIHVLVMSLGLALRMRQIQHDKAVAEQEIAFAAQRSEEQRRFVAMLSHEFRNPLAAIGRAAQMIQLGRRELGPKEAERLEYIRSHVGTLFNLVDNFLVSESLDHDALGVSREHCPLYPLLEQVVEVFGETEAARVVLKVEPGDAAWLLDETLMAMAVGNLVGNALRYSPPASPVDVSAVVDDDGLLIRVADQGPGVSAGELKMLGVPYYRASSAAGKKGSGLGYYFSKRIVEAHGGTLLVNSEPGQGMEVTLRLSAGAGGRQCARMAYAQAG